MRHWDRTRQDGPLTVQVEHAGDALTVRAVGELSRSTAETFEAETLLQIVEAAMSSEIYELMKRSDEVEVVEKAARRPRLAEDCVREAIRGTLERYGDLGDDAFVAAHQESLETVQQHCVLAECFGRFGELRRDGARRTTLREWLSAA